MIYSKKIFFCVSMLLSGVIGTVWGMDYQDRRNNYPDWCKKLGLNLWVNSPAEVDKALLNSNNKDTDLIKAAEGIKALLTQLQKLQKDGTFFSRTKHSYTGLFTKKIAVEEGERVLLGSLNNYIRERVYRQYAYSTYNYKEFCFLGLCGFSALVYLKREELKDIISSGTMSVLNIFLKK